MSLHPKFSRQYLGGYLRKARLNAQLSEEEAARYAEVHNAQMIHEIEEGNQPLSLEQLYAFANVYNIDPDELMELLFELTQLPRTSNESEIDSRLREAK